MQKNRFKPHRKAFTGEILLSFEEIAHSTIFSC